MAKDSIIFIASCIMSQQSVIDDAECNETFKVQHAVLYNGHVCPVTGHMFPFRLRKLYINGNSTPTLHLARLDNDTPSFVWPVGKSLEEAVEDFNQDAKDLHMPTLQILCQ
jgi:hypothetical protein